MCVTTGLNCNDKMINRSKLGRAVRGVLTRAKVERRLICGLLPAISYLEKSPDNVLLCVLPQTRPGDAATHMQAVLLQAFCYENYIPVIQVDSSDKLGEYCNNYLDACYKCTNNCTCAIITKDMSLPFSDALDSPQPMSPTEQVLTEFYECTLEEFPRPVIQLPI